jgi:hypothetical protein
MNTVIASQSTAPASTPGIGRRSAMRRCFGVVVQGQSYRNIAYLLLGLVLATIWLTALVTALSVSLGLVVVALLGVPLLLGTWYVVRAFANVERGLANGLLGQHLPAAPLASGQRGNPWARLVAMSRERSRWLELTYLFLRVPVGIVTFTVAVVALAAPLAIVWTPIHARQVDDFGHWSGSSELHDVATSAWTWGLVPLGLGLVVVSMHLMNALAHGCGRWSARWLDIDRPLQRCG